MVRNSLTSVGRQTAIAAEAKRVVHPKATSASLRHAMDMTACSGSSPLLCDLVLDAILDGHVRSVAPDFADGMIPVAKPSAATLAKPAPAVAAAAVPARATQQPPVIAGRLPAAPAHGPGAARRNAPPPAVAANAVVAEDSDISDPPSVEDF